MASIDETTNQSAQEELTPQATIVSLSSLSMSSLIGYRDILRRLALDNTISSAQLLGVRIMPSGRRQFTLSVMAYRLFGEIFSECFNMAIICEPNALMDTRLAFLGV